MVATEKIKGKIGNDIHYAFNIYCLPATNPTVFGWMMKDTILALLYAYAGTRVQEFHQTHGGSKELIFTDEQLGWFCKRVTGPYPKSVPELESE